MDAQHSQHFTTKGVTCLAAAWIIGAMMDPEPGLKFLVLPLACGIVWLTMAVLSLKK